MKDSVCKVMGIVNVTPDSFSDGGKYFQASEAVRRARNMLEEGASIIDIGGESTRPGSTAIAWQEEWSRIKDVVASLVELRAKADAKGKGSFRISVDTYHPETAKLAVEAGIDIINCVYAGPVPEMLKILEAHDGVELILPSQFDTAAVPQKLLPRLILDPMIGFGTTREEDLEILRNIKKLSQKGRVLIGASRKRIVKKLTGEKTTGKNLGGNLAIAMWSALNGAEIVRVHDVKETVQAVKTAAVLSGKAMME